MSKKQLQQFLVRTAFSSFKRKETKLAEPAETETEKDTNPSITAPAEAASTEQEQVEVVVNKGQDRFLPWSIIWLSIVLILGGTGIIGGLLLTSVPPLPNCQQLSPLAADSERLYCAEMAAQSGKLDQLTAAMKVIEDWTESHPLYSEAQRKLNEWSQRLLAIARQKIDQGDLQASIDTIGRIPVNSPIYPDAQAKIADWQQEWKQGEKIEQEFQNSLKAQNWLQASARGQDLSKLGIEYWRSSRLDELMKQLIIEQRSAQQLQEARELAKFNTPDQLQEAIALAGKVAPKSYVAKAAQNDRQQWSRLLLKIASGKFSIQDFAAVVDVAKKVPTDLPAAREAQDWIKLSLAQSSAQKANIFSLSEGIAGLRQIGADSPLSKQAQVRKYIWQSKLEDELQLQFAKAIASIDQPFAFALAIKQAKLVAPKRPEYPQATQLITNWQQKIQKISDRNTLVTAQQLSKPGTIESLKAAVSKASQIKLGSDFRLQAQTVIAQWTRQIQTIEDQPLLDLARTFAQKGDLIAAVQSAQQIRAGRALYPEAKAAINDWVAQIQIAEDRPILQTATALADQGNLTAAIQTASQITSGRPLYEQAQNAIGLWKSKLAPPEPQTLSIPSLRYDNQESTPTRRTRRFRNQETQNTSEEAPIRRRRRRVRVDNDE